MICDDRPAIVAISDGQHRKDPVSFREVDLPPTGSGPGEHGDAASKRYVETVGPSWARLLGAAYADFDRRISELGLTFRVDAGGFEQEVTAEGVQRRDLHYHELDRPGAAALELNFVLQEPFRWQIHCPGLRALGGAFYLPSGVQAWISAAHPVHHDGDRLWIELPAGTHSIMLVVLSHRTGVELHDTALVVRPEDAVIAAFAQACVPTRLLPTLPVVSDDDLREAGAVLAELGIGRAVLVDALADRASALGLADDGVVVLATQTDADWPGALATALQPDAAQRIPEVRDLDGDTARALYEQLAGPPDAAASSTGMVVCDTARPCVRVIAAAYAALAGYTLDLLDVDEEPIAAPDWSAAHPEHLEIRIERHRVALAEQVSRVIAPRLQLAAPAVAVAFTRGYAYSLLRGDHGPWGGEVELGMLPEDQAPALLLRALGHGSAPASRSGVTLLVDALGRPGHGSEYEPVRESALATVARPVGLANENATAATLRGAAGELPVDLITLICHGERDFVQLTDGPLRAAELATWRLPSAPIVFNNSCGSLHTTGPAFLTAGARAYVGTLWPVETGAAAWVCAEMVRTLTSFAETRLGAALRDALAGASELEYDDRFAYVLVGLPTVPARLAPVLDDRQRAEIAEHGLRAAYAGAGRLIDAGRYAVARWMRANVIEALLVDLGAAMSADNLGGWLEVHNVPGAQLDAIAATYDVDFLRHLGTSGGVATDDLIEAHERAVEAWEAALQIDDDLMTRVERRGQVVASLLASLTNLLQEAGHGAAAWRTALRTTAVVTNPSEPIPLDPPEVNEEALVRAALALREPEYLNALGLLAAEHIGPDAAERCFRAGLELTTDPGETGRITSNLAKLYHDQHRLAEAAAGYAEALPLLQAAGDSRSIGVTRSHLARLRLDQGDVDGAESLARELVSTLAGDDSPGAVGAWWDADAILISALAAAHRYREAADRAQERHRRACATGVASEAWKALNALLDLRLRSVIGGTDRASIADLVRAANATVRQFPDDPAPLRADIARLLAVNQRTFSTVLAGRDADMLLEVLSDLRGSGSTRAERRVLAERAGSAEAQAVVEEVCARAAWWRECVVWLSPADGRTRSMILDQPPTLVSRPASIRYPVIETPNASVRDAYVENVACWARMRGAVAYRFDGTPGLIVIERVGLVRETPHGHRYRDVWGSHQFLYHLRVDLPAPAIVTAIDLRPHGIGLRPRIGLGRNGQSMTVVLDPGQIIERLAEQGQRGSFGAGWLATVTIDFANVPPIHEVVIGHLEEHQLLPLGVYINTMNRLASVLTSAAL